MPDKPSSPELLLLHLRLHHAEEQVIGASLPQCLDNPDEVLVVYNGQLDIFAVPYCDGEPAGVRRYLFSVLPGDGAFGINSADSLQLIAVGSANTKILRTSTSALATLLTNPTFRTATQALIERWVHVFTQRLATKLPPENCLKLEKQARLVFEQTQSVSAQKELIWVRHIQGSARFGGEPNGPRLNGKAWWPLTRHGWIEVAAASELQATDTYALFEQRQLWNNLQAFHATCQTILQQRLDAARSASQQQFSRLRASDLATTEAALHTLTQPIDAIRPKKRHPSSRQNSLPPLLTAMQRVLAELGVRRDAPENWRELMASPDVMSAMTVAMNVQQREVLLRQEWWTHDHGPLLGYCKQRNRSVALLPKRTGGYVLVDPAQSDEVVISAEVAETLSDFATMFYPALPAKSLTWRDLILLGLRGQRRDMVTNMAAGLLAVLVSLILPFATGILFDQIVPSGDLTVLWQFGLAFVVTVLSAGVFRIVQNLTMLRIQGKLNLAVEASVWQRLLELPPSFFHQFSAGDLGARAMGIATIQQTLSGSVLATLLSSVFAFVTVGLLFYYDSLLAVWGIGLAAIGLAAISITAWVQLQHERAALQAEGNLTGRVLQLIGGISKFRAAGAEKRAFALWADAFAEARLFRVLSRRVSVRYAVFRSAYAVVLLIAIFMLVVYGRDRFLSIGAFLAFQAAFGQFMGAVLGIGRILSSILRVGPLYERAKPILQTLPEAQEQAVAPPVLSGALEVNNVSFRYEADSAENVLNSVTLQANPGEFIAIVGPSGSGKSTLVRLLLGFEQPNDGHIFFDDHDLATLDQRAVRRQLGVVLQNGKVIGGTILENIMGPHVADDLQIYRAARLAGLLSDIKQMPMGFHTILSDGGGTLSGGQRQRLLLARAILNSPRILLLDEATSALDNKTQALVMRNLAKLQSTRIVVAHRLQTIQDADRIYVLDAGSVVGEGSYRELLETCPLFAELVKRQHASAAA